MALYLGTQKVAPITNITFAEENDVNFYDYDGTIIASYAADEFMNLTSLPSNPIHKGLTSQGWNWDLEDAQDYVEEYGMLDIGQMYVTDDNKTRIYITLEEGYLSPYLGFSLNGTAVVNWGDGTSEEMTGNNANTTIYAQHNYSNAGDYVIEIESNVSLGFSGTWGGTYLFTKDKTADARSYPYYYAIKKIELSNNIRLNQLAFVFCRLLSTITIPKGITGIGGYVFRYCFSLKNLIIPNDVTTIGMYCCESNYSLKNISIPISVTSISSHVFNNCTTLSRLLIPTNAKYTTGGIARNCVFLKNIVLPNNCMENYTSTQDSFTGCATLTKIKVPNTLININAYEFNGLSNMRYYDFSDHEVVPTLNNINAFNGISVNCKIIVPDDLYESWIAATNWSTYADHIIKASEV